MSTWGRCSPEIDPDADAPLLERVGGAEGDSRWPVAVGTLVVVALVGILWVKPWQRPIAEGVIAARQTSAAPTPTLAPTTTPSPGPTPTIIPATAALNCRQCQSTSTLRMVSSEVTVTRQTRTIFGVQPREATGPTDSTIPLGRLYARSLRAVGVCVPLTTVMSPVDELLHVVLWRVDGTGAAREVVAPVNADVPLFDLCEAYYAPPADEDQLWPAGRYVFEIRPIAGRGGSRWMGIEFFPTDARGAVAGRS